MITDLHAKLAEALDEREIIDAALVMLGGEHLARGGKPPRIVMVPVGGPGGASRIGPAGSRSSNPRSLRERSVQIDFHCWGADFNAAEELLRGLIAALHSFAVGAYELAGETWPEGNADVAAYGRLVVVHVVVRSPVLDQRESTGTITRTIVTTETAPAVVMEDDGDGGS
jgi:hypothetical protein